MKTETLHILMLEDDEMDAQIIKIHLEKDLSIETKIVVTKADYIKALENEKFDVILSDHNLPIFNSLEALQIRNQKNLFTPFILVSGKIPEDYAVALLQEGASDYILKDRPQRLSAAILEAIEKQKNLEEKLRTEKELIETNERLKLVLKATDDAIWDWNSISDEITWGEGMTTVFGYDPKDHLNLEQWASHLHPADKDRVVNRLMDAKKNTGTNNWQEEFRYFKCDGSIAFVISKGIIMRNAEGQVIRMIGAMQDLTELRQLERALVEEKISKQKEIAETTLKVEERERNSIGKELHDNVNQLLASSKLLIEAALTSADIHDLCLQKSLEAISTAINEVRQISHYMITPSLDNGQLLNAIREMVDNVNLSGKLQATFQINEPVEFEKAPPEIKVATYRIIQEQMNNILKYSKATNASIQITVSQKTLSLEVIDNGIGFDACIKSRGIGLRNISGRTEFYGGKMEVLTSPGNGCSITIELPVTWET